MFRETKKGKENQKKRKERKQRGREGKEKGRGRKERSILIPRCCFKKPRRKGIGGKKGAKSKEEKNEGGKEYKG